LLDVVVPYFKAGLENKEFCMWSVLYPFNVEEARSALRRAMLGAEQHFAAGDIEIVPYSAWYLRDGTFDIERVIEASREKLAQALARGYAGLRLSGNESSPLAAHRPGRLR
jgi:hypothetical protein